MRTNAGYLHNAIYGANHNPNDATSTPNYDNWGIDTYWSCYDWVTWYYALKSAYGKEKAKSTFLQALYKSDKFEHVRWCPFDTPFNKLAQDENMPEVTNWIARIYNSAGNTVANAGSALSTLSKLLPVLAIGFVADWIYKNVK